MDNQVVRFALALSRGIQSPLSDRFSELVRKGAWAELQELRVQPASYSDAEVLFQDNLLVDLLRKCDIPNTGVDKEAEAVRTFYECESRNCRTNAYLWKYLPENDLWSPPEKEAHVVEFINLMRKDISAILGPLPEYLVPRFSNGATVSDKGSKTTIPDKLSSKPTFYRGSACLLPFIWETSWGTVLHARGEIPIETRGNVFFTVPKDATKHRGCCKEASVNVTLQLDVGAFLKRRLKLIGIDLVQGQDLHRRKAWEASLFGHLATIDMSNASDTLCRNLVKAVLPDCWYQLLDSLRAPFTRVGKKQVLLEKFSSMGNGFTFELETLIFSSVARVAARLLGSSVTDVSCYGDDLIVPSETAKLVLNALELFGFEPNRKKTFVEGPFRESCGGDYFRGIPVRGLYLKTIPDEPHQWISVLNGLRRVCTINGSLDSRRWSLVVRAWSVALGFIPSEIRACRGPSHLGDLVIHDEEPLWATKQDRNGTVFVRAWKPIPFRVSLSRWCATVQLASCTLVNGTGITPRGMVSGYKHTWVPCHVTSHWLPPVRY